MRELYVDGREFTDLYNAERYPASYHEYIGVSSGYHQIVYFERGEGKVAIPNIIYRVSVESLPKSFPERPQKEFSLFDGFNEGVHQDASTDQE